MIYDVHISMKVHFTVPIEAEDEMGVARGFQSSRRDWIRLAADDQESCIDGIALEVVPEGYYRDDDTLELSRQKYANAVRFSEKDMARFLNEALSRLTPEELAAITIPARA